MSRGPRIRCRRCAGPVAAWCVCAVWRLAGEVTSNGELA